ncbi:response regulator [Fibrella sp. USSR17]
MTTILVVDDETDLEPLLVNWFRRQIRQNEYAFHFASGGEEALAILNSEPAIDLLLLDINMPGMDGLTLLEKLPVVNPLLRAVMVSAYSDMANIRTAMNRGAFDFVCKPISFADLELTIEKTAHHVRQLRESQQLKVIDELKTRFFDNITHEFRTPLTLILAPVQQLLQRFNDSAELQHSLGMIERNARQLLRLINQLLDLAKLESGNLPLSMQAGDLGTFVGNLVQAFELAAREKALMLRYENELTDFYSFDPDKLEQIVHNLLSNALKFTRVGEVTVRATATTTGLSLIVTDTGIGIVPEKLPYIFDRFYQVYHPSTNGLPFEHAYPGTGIGLALVKELAELLGGSVSVSSTLGDGTTFTIDLPLPRVDRGEVSEWPARSFTENLQAVAAVNRGDKVLNSEGASPDKPLVLIVEDNADLNAFIAGELADTYRLMTATDGIEGWERALAELPDLVISDVMMPGMDGYQLTQRLKTDPATEHIAVVLLTAKTAHTSLIEGLTYGADDYIGKPFQVDELRLRIHNLVARQQALRAHFNAQLSHPDEPIGGAASSDAFIKNLYTHLEANLDDSQFRVGELAEAIGMSRRTLHRKLTSLTGFNVSDLIRHYRLKRSRELLQQGHNVSETAYLVGYESASHFSTTFKEFFGMTPTDHVLNTSAGN